MEGNPLGALGKKRKSLEANFIIFVITNHANLKGGKGRTIEGRIQEQE